MSTRVSQRDFRRINLDRFFSIKFSAKELGDHFGMQFSGMGGGGGGESWFQFRENLNMKITSI